MVPGMLIAVALMCMCGLVLAMRYRYGRSIRHFMMLFVHDSTLQTRSLLGVDGVVYTP
jgi:hypothetical protein